VQRNFVTAKTGTELCSFGSLKTGCRSKCFPP